MTIARHVSAEQDPLERGLAFGRALQAEVRNTVNSYLRLFQATLGLGRREADVLGDEVAEYLRVRWPDAAAEIQGIAEGAGVHPLTLFAVNARTEILAGAQPPECSAIGVTPRVGADGHTYLAQNWDWHPDLRSSRVVWQVQTYGGSFTTLTEAGLLAKIGCNSHGVGLCLNILGTTVDGGVRGLPIHVACRLILQTCTSLADALRLLMNERFAGSSCFNVGCADDAGGALASVEISPGGYRCLPAHDGWLLHTNHFVADLPRGTDSYVQKWTDSLVRLWHLAEQVQAIQRPVGPADIELLLKSHHGGDIAVCCHDFGNSTYADQQGTLASVLMDLTEQTMRISDGPPCQNGFEYFSGPASGSATSAEGRAGGVVTVPGT